MIKKKIDIIANRVAQRNGITLDDLKKMHGIGVNKSFYARVKEARIELAKMSVITSPQMLSYYWRLPAHLFY